MITATDLSGALERNLGIIKAQTQGLSHEDSLLQLPFRGNCLNWVLGHIADNRNTMLRFLGEEAILSEVHSTRYGYNSEPVCGDAGDILTLEQLLTVLEQSQSALTARLQNITAEELAREEQSFLGTTTLGQLIFFLFWHESYHAGQPEYLRQLTGKDDKVIWDAEDDPIIVREANPDVAIAAVKPYQGNVYHTSLPTEAEEELRRVLKRRM